MADKQYIGDAVYVEYESDRDALILTVEDGLSVEHTIIMEPSVFRTLLMYARNYTPWRLP